METDPVGQGRADQVSRTKGVGGSWSGFAEELRVVRSGTHP